MHARTCCVKLFFLLTLLSYDNKLELKYMATTQAQIANLLNLSRAAVSHVLNHPEHPRYPAQTRKRILETASKLDYVPNRLVTGIKGQQTRTLAFVVPYNMPDMMDAAQQTANELGYVLQIHYTYKPDSDAEIRAIRSALELRVDGIIWMPGSNDSKAYRDIVRAVRRNGCKVVFLDKRLDGLEQSSLVSLDLKKTFTMALEHLRVQSYEHIWYVANKPLHGPSRHNRAQMFKTLQGENARMILTENLMGEDLDPLLVDTIRSVSGRVGLIANGEFNAVRCLKLITAAGLRIPEDVGIISIGDMLVGGWLRVCELISPAITSVQQQNQMRGEQSVRIMVQQLENSSPSKGHVDTEHNLCHLNIVPELIIRESTTKNKP